MFVEALLSTDENPNILRLLKIQRPELRLATLDRWIEQKLDPADTPPKLPSTSPRLRKELVDVVYQNLVELAVKAPLTGERLAALFENLSQKHNEITSYNFGALKAHIKIATKRACREAKVSIPVLDEDFQELVTAAFKATDFFIRFPTIEGYLENFAQWQKCTNEQARTVVESLKTSAPFRSLASSEKGKERK